MNIINNNLGIILTVIISVIALSGCQTKPNMYYWGEYESLIYKMYAEPGTVEPDIQIEKLKKDILHSQEKGKKTPPGIHAHLGFMYAASGNLALAKDAFTQEKTLFPESAKFIDGMMERAFKGNKS